jgi:hypothetical protein
LFLERLEDRNAPSDTLSAILQAAGLNAVAEEFATPPQVAALADFDFATSNEPLAAVSLAPATPATADLTHWLPPTQNEPEAFATNVPQSEPEALATAKPATVANASGSDGDTPPTANTLFCPPSGNSFRFLTINQ